MKKLKKIFVLLLKKVELGSAIAVRLTKYTGKSKVYIHPKHFLTQNPWYSRYIGKNDVVLDLGSGNGQSAIKVSKLCKKVVGLEIGKNLIEIAQKTARDQKVKNVIFKNADLEDDLSLRSNYFNKVIFLDVLEHLERRDKILEEIKRVLKPGGLLFLAVPNSQTSWKKLQRSVGISSYSDPDHKIEFSEKEAKNLLKKYKFKIQDFSYSTIDTPLRGFYDIIGAFSIPIYRKISNWRREKAQEFPINASGFEIVCTSEK